MYTGDDDEYWGSRRVVGIDLWIARPIPAVAVGYSSWLERTRWPSSISKTRRLPDHHDTTFPNGVVVAGAARGCRSVGCIE